MGALTDLPQLDGLVGAGRHHDADSGQDGDGPDGKGMAGQGGLTAAVHPDLGRHVPGARHKGAELAHVDAGDVLGVAVEDVERLLEGREEGADLAVLAAGVDQVRGRGVVLRRLYVYSARNIPGRMKKVMNHEGWRGYLCLNNSHLLQFRFCHLSASLICMGKVLTWCGPCRPSWRCRCMLSCCWYHSLAKI